MSNVIILCDSSVIGLDPDRMASGSGSDSGLPMCELRRMKSDGGFTRWIRIGRYANVTVITSCRFSEPCNIYLNEFRQVASDLRCF